MNNVEPVFPNRTVLLKINLFSPKSKGRIYLGGNLQNWNFYLLCEKRLGIASCWCSQLQLSGVSTQHAGGLVDYLLQYVVLQAMLVLVV